MSERSNLEDKAMAAGLIALGAAIPIYEGVTERVREFGRTPAGKVMRVTAATGATVASGAVKGVRSLLDRRVELTS